jgi:cysteine-rich repeat protein
LETALGEQCDDGNRVNGDGCSADCRFERSYDCGDGILNRETEQCDSGANNGSGPSSCRENCILPYCGDGILDFSEICDDGNKLSGDNCSALCELERRAPPPPIVAGLITQTPQVPGLPGQETIPEYEYQVTRVPPPARTPTGPGLVIFLASGAAAGIGFTRRRFRGGK